jgi:hypothetical protein
MDTNTKSSGISSTPLTEARASPTWSTALVYLNNYCILPPYLLSKKSVHGGSNCIKLHESLVDNHTKSLSILSTPLTRARASPTWSTALVYLTKYCFLSAYLLSKKCVHDEGS